MGSIWVTRVPGRKVMGQKTPVEELDLSVRAYNVLKADDIDFIEDVQAYLDRARHPLSRRNPNLRRVEAEITERLRRWRGDPGGAGVPALR